MKDSFFRIENGKKKELFSLHQVIENKNFIKADRVKFLSSGGKKESGDADAPQSDKAPSKPVSHGSEDEDDVPF